MPNTRIYLLLLALAAGLAAAGRVQARNVDLSTVPNRDTVQLTIYNSEDLTLVRETRKVSFKKGVNPLQFSWANTLIDPTSVELRFLTSRTSWKCWTRPSRTTSRRCSTGTSRARSTARRPSRSPTSPAASVGRPTTCWWPTRRRRRSNFEGFVRVSNNSGEEYEDAQVRLVVGKINLVEKIAQLARIPMQEVDRLDEDARTSLRLEAAKEVMARRRAEAAEAAGAPLRKPSPRRSSRRA